uniref:Uncharacterized protein n=1 Tax=Aegilops tauschii subsp. strangulata TaxID=200361 RepID=A0A452Z445_AEGTS
MCIYKKCLARKKCGFSSSTGSKILDSSIKKKERFYTLPRLASTCSASTCRPAAPVFSWSGRRGVVSPGSPCRP